MKKVYIVWCHRERYNDKPLAIFDNWDDAQKYERMANKNRLWRSNSHSWCEIYRFDIKENNHNIFNMEVGE
jgi:hypothetical protein